MFAHLSFLPFLVLLVWGRSRLPISESDWTMAFTIHSLKEADETKLPISHTCFFRSVDRVTQHRRDEELVIGRRPLADDLISLLDFFPPL